MIIVDLRHLPGYAPPVACSLTELQSTVVVVATSTVVVVGIVVTDVTSTSDVPMDRISVHRSLGWLLWHMSRMPDQEEIARNLPLTINSQNACGELSNNGLCRECRRRRNRYGVRSLGDSASWQRRSAVNDSDAGACRGVQYCIGLTVVGRISGDVGWLDCLRRALSSTFFNGLMMWHEFWPRLTPRFLCTTTSTVEVTTPVVVTAVET